jgi:hypothetical protein
MLFKEELSLYKNSAIICSTYCQWSTRKQITTYSTYALAKLNPCSNEIGDEGPEHLASALKQNKVTSSSSHPTTH